MPVPMATRLQLLRVELAFDGVASPRATPSSPRRSRAARGSRPCCRLGQPLPRKKRRACGLLAGRCRAGRASARAGGSAGSRQTRQIWRTRRWQVTAESEPASSERGTPSWRRSSTAWLARWAVTRPITSTLVASWVARWRCPRPASRRGPAPPAHRHHAAQRLLHLVRRPRPRPGARLRSAIGAATPARGRRARRAPGSSSANRSWCGRR